MEKPTFIFGFFWCLSSPTRKSKATEIICLGGVAKQQRPATPGRPLHRLPDAHEARLPSTAPPYIRTITQPPNQIQRAPVQHLEAPFHICRFNQNAPKAPARPAATHVSTSGTATISNCIPQLCTVVISPVLRSAMNRLQVPFGVVSRNEPKLPDVASGFQIPVGTPAPP